VQTLISKLAHFTILCLVLTTTSWAQSPGYVRTKAPFERVFVFVHGIFGDSLGTWKNSGNKYLWDFVADDPVMSTSNIYVYGFPSRYLSSSFTVDEAADDLHQRIDVDAVNKHKQIIFVAHSMGGLVVETMLLRYRDLAAKTPLILLYSTPHEGSDISSIARLVSKNPGLETMISGDKNLHLARLEGDWRNAKFPTQIRCAHETQKTFGVQIVSRLSATRPCTGSSTPVDANHIEMVKPTDKSSGAVVALRSALQAIPSIQQAASPAPAASQPPSSTTPSAASYGGIKRNEDLRWVRTYLAYNGSRVVPRTSISPGCSNRTMSRSTEIGFTDKEITVVRDETDESLCATRRNNRVKSVCIAKTADVDQILTAGFGETPNERNFGLRCLSGACFQCDYLNQTLKSDGSVANEKMTVSNKDVDVWAFTVGGGYPGDDSLTKFLGALTRIIGDGNNDPFCSAQRHLCPK